MSYDIFRVRTLEEAFPASSIDMQKRKLCNIYIVLSISKWIVHGLFYRPYETTIYSNKIIDNQSMMCIIYRDIRNQGRYEESPNYIFNKTFEKN